MRYFIVLSVILAWMMAAGCQNVSATQPSPVLMLGETLAYNGVKNAVNKAYAAERIEYHQYIVVIDTLATLKARAMANGGALTVADFRAAIEVGVWRIIQEYLPEYLKEPETLPPPPPSPMLYDNTPVPE